MKLLEIIKELATHEVITSLHYNDKSGAFYLDLQTGAKSHRYLFENGLIEGRYDYQGKVDLTDDMDSIIENLCWEFKDSMCGRNYGNAEWLELSTQKF